jgi:inosine/xanthosine triphosphatase
MIIAIGSTNEAKVQAVKEVLKSSSHFEKAKVISLLISSGVSDQPLSLEETIQGAKNRAKNAFGKCDSCQYGFGIESGLMAAPGTSTGYLNISICCIYDGDSVHTGMSCGFEVPVQALELLIEKKMDLTQACLNTGITKNSNIGSTEGLIGILTKGKIDRKEYSKQCILLAIAQIEHADWYLPQVLNIDQ